MDARSSASLALPGSRRLRLGRDFAKARTQGRRVVQGCLMLNWLVRQAGSDSRLGVITTRKLGNAVVRTRARRLLREAFRLRQHCLAKPADIVLLARASVVGKGLADVEQDYLTALRRAGLFRPESATAATA